MAARFEIHVEHRIRRYGLGAESSQTTHFRVSLTRALMPTFGKNVFTMHQHGTDQRVGCCGVSAVPRELQASCHPTRIDGRATGGHIRTAKFGRSRSTGMRFLGITGSEGAGRFTFVS